MEVDFAFLARSAVVRDLYILDIVAAGIEDITAVSFPFVLDGLVFVMRFRLHPMEVEHDHEVIVELWDPDGTRLMQTRGTTASASYQGAPGRSTFIPLIVPLENLVFQRPGSYSFEVVADGIHLKSTTFYVESSSTAKG